MTPLNASHPQPIEQLKNLIFIENCLKMKPGFHERSEIQRLQGARGIHGKSKLFFEKVSLISSLQMGVLLGGEKNRTRRLMNNILDFETRLAEITVPDEERRDEEKMYHQMAIAELQEVAPFVSKFASIFILFSNNFCSPIHEEQMSAVQGIPKRFSAAHSTK